MREDLKYEQLALDLGFTVKHGRTVADSYTFIKGSTHIWECTIRDRIMWQCADLYQNGHYQNHRPYYSLDTALIEESGLFMSFAEWQDKHEEEVLIQAYDKYLDDTMRQLREVP